MNPAANTARNPYRIPTLHYGPGESALAHAADERVPVDEVLHCARTLALLALDVCGVA
jgi:acetylornithine deacetylase